MSRDPQDVLTPGLPGIPDLASGYGEPPVEAPATPLPCSSRARA